MDPSGAVELDEQNPSLPAPTPLPEPRNRPKSLFYDPTEDPQEESLTGMGEDDDGSASGDPWTSEPSGDPGDVDPTSWETSPAAGDKPAALLSKAQMRATARTAVTIGTGMAHTVAAKTPAQKQLGLYLADDDDAKAIGEPLADIAYRRGDVLGGKLNPDANDLLRSMMGVAGYFAKQVAKIGEVRRIEAGVAAAEVQQFPTGEVA